MATAPCSIAGHSCEHCPKPGTFDAVAMCCSDSCQGPLHKISVLFVHKNCGNVSHNYFIYMYIYILFI